MKAVITGGTGAIGMALLEELIQRGCHATVLCRADSRGKARIPVHPLVRTVVCPLSEIKNFTLPEGENCDVFFHLAWEGTTGDARNDMVLQTRNVAYTLDAVKLAKRMGCHTFVGAGSQAEYGRVTEALTARTPTFPENGYGMAKLCAGQMSREMCRSLGMRHVWARILSVYGPHDNERSLVRSTMRKLMAGEHVSLTAGEQIWDYLYSGDAARALLALAEHGADGKVYCLGGGDPRSLRAYMEELRDVVAPNAPLGFGELPYAERQVMYLTADLRELYDDTGFRPRVSFAEGIRCTAAHLAAEQAITKTEYPT